MPRDWKEAPSESAGKVQFPLGQRNGRRSVSLLGAFIALTRIAPETASVSREKPGLKEKASAV
jgi:hypothetical protein